MNEQSEQSSAQRTALASAALVFALVAPVTYSLERIYERLRSGKHDPTLIVSEVHAGFYWRAIIATWWAGLLAMVAYRLLLDRQERTARMTDRLLYLALALAPVIGWLSYRFP